jgi:hypothetical protein
MSAHAQSAESDDDCEFLLLRLMQPRKAKQFQLRFYAILYSFVAVEKIARRDQVMMIRQICQTRAHAGRELG